MAQYLSHGLLICTLVVCTLQKHSCPHAREPHGGLGVALVTARGDTVERAGQASEQGRDRLHGDGTSCVPLTP